MPRRVRVVNIDDFNQLDPERFAPFIELLPIASELQAQELLAKMCDSDRAPIDIFLVDIDMSENWRRLPAGVYWGPDEEGENTPLRPYGPMLAVPFLMSGAEIIFVPYSNWWGSPAVHSNGFVLLSCAFIFSRVYGGVWTLDRTRDYIRDRFRQPEASTADPNEAAIAVDNEEIKVDGAAPSDEPAGSDDRSLLLEPEKALRTGLLRLRKHLQKAPGIQFVNVEATCRQLEALDDAPQDHGMPLRDPDTGEAISVEWVSARRRDSVEVSSLYADVLDFGVDIDHRKILELTRRVQNEIAPRSIENVGTLYDIAKQALAECSRDPKSPRRLDQVLKAKKKEVQIRLTADQWQLIKRLAVLFAWVRAWREEEDSEKRVTCVRSFLGFPRGKKGATTSYNRFIRGGDRSTERKGRWHQPFKRHHKNGLASGDFKLDADQPEALCVLESSLCIRYADQELSWIEDSPQGLLKYPRWMTEPDEKPFGP